MIIGDNYGEYDTETGERKGFVANGICIHYFQLTKSEDGNSYQQCGYCGEREPLIEKKS